MAKVTEQIAVLVGTQTGEGSINTTIRDATTIATGTGLLIRDESLSLDFDRIEEPGEDVTGTFSRTPGTLLRTEAGTFSFDTTLKGSGQTLGPADGDHDLPVPVVALLNGAGVVDASSDSDATNYGLTTDPTFLTIKVWRGAISYTFQDCRVSFSLAVSPGNVAVLTTTVNPGAIIKASQAFPTTIDYGLQQSTQAPVFVSMGAALGSVTRGVLEGTLEITPTLEQFPDGNLPTGFSNEVTGREIRFTGQMYVDSTDLDQDFDNVARTTGYEDLVFRLGVLDSDPSNSLAFTLQNMVVEQASLAETAGRIVFNLNGFATSPGSGNDEFTMVSE